MTVDIRRDKTRLERPPWKGLSNRMGRKHFCRRYKAKCYHTFSLDWESVQQRLDDVSAVQAGHRPGGHHPEESLCDLQLSRMPVKSMSVCLLRQWAGWWLESSFWSVSLQSGHLTEGLWESLEPVRSLIHSGFESSFKHRWVVTQAQHSIPMPRAKVDVKWSQLCVL